MEWKFSKKQLLPPVLSGSTLKWIAIVTMLIDHIGAVIFENAFIKAPLLYAVALSLWRGIVSLFVMTFGFVLALYCKNIFVILTGPFMYSILENFVLAILRLERLRLVVAFDPTTVNPEVVSIFSFFFGPIVLSIVIGLTAFLLSKKNAIVTI